MDRLNALKGRRLIATAFKTKTSCFIVRARAGPRIAGERGWNVAGDSAIPDGVKVEVPDFPRRSVIFRGQFGGPATRTQLAPLLGRWHRPEDRISRKSQPRSRGQSNDDGASHGRLLVGDS
jgi:hypothetical protein